MDWYEELERKLDLILNKLEVGYSETQLSQQFSDVKALANSGKMLEAIKLYREQTGAGLAQAKEFVEGAKAGGEQIYQRIQGKVDVLLRKLEIPYEPGTNPPEYQFYEQIKALLRSNNKIEAIKVYREATNLGLKEAKDAVDAIEREMRKK